VFDRILMLRTNFKILP